MPDVPTSTYDELPYEDLVFAYAHPANMATVASLYGLDPPPIDRCRVLDLGCAAGANLRPMANAWPHGKFVGMDLSTRQIEHGREIAGALGLKNIALHVRNILDGTDDLGQFDYIITHGLYSWVPPAVRDRVMEIIGRQLRPNGVAYVSYNVYPGWHLRGMMRDMLTFHAANVGPPVTQVAQARGFLEFLQSALADGNSAFTSILRDEAETLLAQSDSYLFHEHLETNNTPMCFHQFVAHAAAYGMQYLAEAAPQPLPGHVKPQLLETLTNACPDRNRLEQYLDFLRCRIFRRSLLCHADVAPNFESLSQRIPSMAVSSVARPDAHESNPATGLSEQFVTPQGVRFVTSDAAMRKVMHRLWEARPAAMSFALLLEAAQEAVPSVEGLQSSLANALLQLYLGDIVMLHLYPPVLTAVAGPRPRASALARFAALHNAEIPDLRHSMAKPDAFSRYLLPLLDGTRDRRGLVEVLAERAAAGEFAVQDAAGQPAANPQVLRAALAGWLDEALERLGRSALLEA